MALDNVDKVVALLASGAITPIYKPSLANAAAGQMFSLWQAVGMPTGGATPGAFATCTNALAGSINLPSIGALNGYVGKMSLQGATIGTYLLIDRLGHMGGLSGTVVTAQTANVDIVTASTNGRCLGTGANVEWFIEIYTALGATGVNATVNYNNQSDAAVNAAAIALGATPRAGRLYQIIPNAGTTIKKVNTVTLSATTGTAGNFGITAVKRFCSVGQMLANIAPPGDFASIGAPEFKATSCLQLAVLCSTTSTGILQGELVLGSA